MQNLVKISKIVVDVIPNRNHIRNLHISKIQFLFPFSLTTEYKVGIAEFYLYMGYGAGLLKKCGHQSLKTAEIGIRTPLKSANYFPCVSQTTGVDATTFLRRMQNLVKIGKELWT